MPDSGLELKKHPRLYWLHGLLVLIILLAAAGLRWRYIFQVQLYPDEFVTLLAVKMIMEKGLPLLPSGLFYDHGLLFSYAGAAAAFIGGFSYISVRIASLVFSLLTLIATYKAGRWSFGRTAAVLAVLFLAISPASVLWGGRARMYSLLQLLVLLSCFFFIAGVQKDRPAWRWLAFVCYGGALLTQFAAIALLPPLALYLLFDMWKRKGQKLRIGLQLFTLGLLALMAFAVKRLGQPKGIEPVHGGNWLSGLWEVLSIYGAFNLDLSSAWVSISSFFIAPESIGLSLFALAAITFALWRRMRRRSSPADHAVLAYGGLLAITTLEMLFLVSADRRDEKYLVMLLPIFCLLAARGAAEAGCCLAEHLPALRRAKPALVAAMIGAALCLPMLAPLAEVVDDPRSDYAQAFGYVKEHLNDEDGVASGTPAAAWYYLGRNDYYLVQKGNYDYRILNKSGAAVERWLGSPWIGDLPGLEKTLNQPQRVWLVLERWGLLDEYYDEFFRQQLFAMTSYVREDNGVIVLRNHRGYPLIQESPPLAAQGNLEGKVELLGYDLRRRNDAAASADKEVQIVLYWRCLARLPKDTMVLLHIRDAQGGNVLVADHAPFFGIYPSTLWQPGEVIRETINVTLKADFKPGEYALYTGMYTPDDQRRLTVTNDRSGENALLLGKVKLP
jgi:4-amino-4-deoxy-L-arabinose transferase-like glycosyltransferase